MVLISPIINDNMLNKKNLLFKKFNTAHVRGGKLFSFRSMDYFCVFQTFASNRQRENGVLKVISMGIMIIKLFLTCWQIYWSYQNLSVQCCFC